MVSKLQKACKFIESLEPFWDKQFLDQEQFSEPSQKTWLREKEEDGKYAMSAEVAFKTFC